MSFFRRQKPDETPEQGFEATIDQSIVDTSDTVITSEFDTVFDQLQPAVQRLNFEWQRIRENVRGAKDESEELTQMTAEYTILEEGHDLTTRGQTRIRQQLWSRDKNDALSYGLAVARLEARNELPDHNPHIQNLRQIDADEPLLATAINGYAQNIDAFTAIELQTKTVLETVGEYLIEGPEQALAFVDWVKAANEDAAFDPRTAILLRTLSSDYLDPNSDHVIQGSIDELFNEKQMTLLQEFLTDYLAQDNEATQTMRYMWETAGDGEIDSLAAHLQQTQEQWPQFMTERYQAFTADLQKEIHATLRAALAKHRVGYMEIPTIEQVNQMNNQIMEKMEHDSQFGAVNAKKRAVKSRSAKSKVSSRNVEVGKSESLPAEFQLALLDQNTPGGLSYDGDALQTMIAEYAAKFPHDKQLVADLQRMVESVKEKPIGNGAVKVRGDQNVLKIAGKPYNLRRLNPVHRKGLSVGELAKGARFTYVLMNDRHGNPVVAIEGLRNHDDYLRFMGY